MTEKSKKPRRSRKASKSKNAPQTEARRNDKFADRESKKYDRPIPSREYILEVLTKEGQPVPFEPLSALLELSTEEDQEALSRRLRAMERDGQLICTRGKGYGIVEKMDLVPGRISATRDGHGFLMPDDGSDDLFLTSRDMRPVLHGDRAVVGVRGVDHRGRREGTVVEVLERNNHELVGRFFTEPSLGFVTPDNKHIPQEILIPREHFGDAKEGDIVVAEIIAQPTRRSPPIGRISEVIGEHMAPGMEIDVAIRAHGVPLKWPEAVENEIAGLTAEVPEGAKLDRVDLRQTPLVTIDGEDARDFDDAVFCERKPKGWRLLVAIADVSHYVESGTGLDKEARERGNSVYFPERVIPMLPEVLSNGLCSLNPHVDRLCMVCELYINEKGSIARSKFFEGVMRSAARLTYTEVSAMLEHGDEKLKEKYKEIMPHLDTLYELYGVLSKARQKRGSIEFDTTETRIQFGPNRKIERIVPLVRNDAHRLIEECMISANVAAARFLLRNKIPGLFRVHGGPKKDKLEDLYTFLAELGLHFKKTRKPKAEHYSQLLSEIKDRPDRHLIETVMLRSMTHAVYTPNNDGHFGLALEAYSHFTSPIRRYPDLLVHRAIRHILRGGTPENFNYSIQDMTLHGEHCLNTERRADEATREAVDWLKCEYMLDKVGEEFEGTVVAVASFGFFVELDDIYAQGLVHISTLRGDYYHFDPVGHRLSGERTGRIYRLGDRLKVLVAQVNLDERKIDFELCDQSSDDGEVPKKRSKRSKKGRKS